MKTYLLYTFLMVISLVVKLDAQSCSISNVFAEPHLCMSDGSFLVDIEFEVELPGNDGFTIAGNGQNYGSFDYGEAFYTIGPLEGDCTTLYEFVIIDNSDSSCSNFYEFVEPICCDNSFCMIDEITIDSMFCNEDGTYGFILDFDHQNTTNDFFDVWAGQEFVGFYNYDDLPVLIDTFYPRTVEYDIIRIFDNDNPDCMGAREFMGPDCDSLECNFYDLTVTEFSCNDDGTYNVSLDFEYDNEIGETFDVWFNFINTYSFRYDALPIRFDSLSKNPDGGFEIFEIADGSMHSCKAELRFEYPNCDSDDCFIGNFVINQTECNPDGTYNFTLNFAHNNTENEFFDLSDNQSILGTYRFSQLPVRVSNFRSRDADYDYIKVCENDNPNCCKEHEFMPPDCDEDEKGCSLDDLFIEAYDCDEDGNFLVDFEFKGMGPGDGFLIRGNGQVYGEYEYGETYYTLGPLNCADVHDEFIIIDLNNEDCQTETGFDKPDCCDEEECTLRDMEVDVIECDEDNASYFLKVTFLGEGPGEGFILRGNGQIHGEFKYENDEFLIGPFQCSETINELVLIDDLYEDCQIVLELELENECCENNEEACNLREFIVDAKDCDADGNFLVVFQLDGSGRGKDFLIRGNGEIYGVFEYGESSYTIGPFNCADAIDEFIIIDGEDDKCLIETGFDKPDCCDEEECSLRDMEVNVVECDEDSASYYLKVSFLGEGPGDGFVIRGNGRIHAEFKYGDEEFFVGPFSCSDMITELVLIDDTFEECFVDIEFNDENDCCDMINSSDRKIIKSNIDILNYDQKITITSEMQEPMTASLISIDGRRLFKKMLTNNVTINTMDIPSGIYVISIQSKNDIYSQKIYIIK